jgi:peptidoglycan/xylan/chitin deacetylase (PgdA/CDA1 family)
VDPGAADGGGCGVGHDGEGAAFVRGQAIRRRVARLTAPVGSVVAVRTLRPQAVLTYDDGPDPTGTGAVLMALREWGATATFFVLLTRARANPGLVRDVVGEGHEVALHGTDHRALTVLHPRDLDARLRSGRAELEDLAGTPVRWLRPPYGRQSVRTWRAARRAGLTPVLWSATLGDSRAMSDTQRLAGLRARLRAGVIILGHDNFAGPGDAAFDGATPPVDRRHLNRRLLWLLDEVGLAGVSLGRALEHGKTARRAWFG